MNGVGRPVRYDITRRARGLTPRRRAGTPPPMLCAAYDAFAFAGFYAPRIPGGRLDV